MLFPRVKQIFRPPGTGEQRCGGGGGDGGDDGDDGGGVNSGGGDGVHGGRNILN